jgi:hypothetical protein
MTWAVLIDLGTRAAVRCGGVLTLGLIKKHVVRSCLGTGLLYDVEVRFSRRHPFEPPAVYFSKTSRNFKNPRHHLVDPTVRRFCLK